jgi:hypothetical protein
MTSSILKHRSNPKWPWHNVVASLVKIHNVWFGYSRWFPCYSFAQSQCHGHTRRIDCTREDGESWSADSFSYSYSSCLVLDSAVGIFRDPTASLWRHLRFSRRHPWDDRSLDWANRVYSDIFLWVDTWGSTSKGCKHTWAGTTWASSLL